MNTTALNPDAKLGDLIDQRAEAYGRVKAINDQLALAKKRVDELDEQILARFDEDGMTQAR